MAPQQPKWDVHHHIVPDFYVQTMKDAGMADLSSMKWPKWNPARSARMMDAFGIEKAFLSVSTPGVVVGDAAFTRQFNTRCNEYMADMIRDHPRRYGAFASVTLPDVDGALGEVAYALGDLHFDGVGLLSNVAGVRLGDKRYRDFFAELNRQRAVVLVHPSGTTEREDHRLLNPLYWWQNDTTRTMVEFVRNGYHRDYPNINWILCHGGGVIAPAYQSLVRALERENSDIAQELAIWKDRLYLDTASKAYDEQIPQLLDFSDPQHVLFGSDLGWAPRSAVRTVIGGYDKASEKFGINSDQLAGIYRGNAQRLFGGEPTSIPCTLRQRIEITSAPAPRESPVAYDYHCLPQAVAELVGAGHSEPIWDADSARKWLAENGYERAMLTVHLPRLWQLPTEETGQVLRCFNDEVAAIRAADPVHFGAFGAVDIREPAGAVAEIDRCIEVLRLDGICLSLDIAHTSLFEFLDERICRKLATLDVPVLLHPHDATGIPLVDEGYLDAVYFLVKSFYLGEYRKHFHNVQFVLAHTAGVVPYLAQPLNILYYLTARHPKIGRYLLDTIIRHKPQGYRAAMAAITAADQ